MGPKWMDLVLTQNSMKKYVREQYKTYSRTLPNSLSY